MRDEVRAGSGGLKWLDFDFIEDLLIDSMYAVGGGRRGGFRWC